MLSQGNSQGISFSARLFDLADLAHPGVALPLVVDEEMIKSSE